MPGGIAGIAAARTGVRGGHQHRLILGERCEWPARQWARRSASLPVFLWAVLALLASASPAGAESSKVRITKLVDVAFGAVANLGVDSARSQSVCLYADTPTNGYTVTAVGSGVGGAFDLSSGTATMPFAVAWSSSGGQTAGTQLTPNVPLTGQVSTATHQTCNNGPATSASLVVILRSTALSSAMAGSYSGTLMLIVGPE